MKVIKKKEIKQKSGEGIPKYMHITPFLHCGPSRRNQLNLIKKIQKIRFEKTKGLSKMIKHFSYESRYMLV